MAASCWQGGYSFATCCRATPGGLGDSRCWSGGFTYESCCLPELRRQLEDGLQLIDEGEYLTASYRFLDLLTNYGKDGADRNHFSAAWEKAVNEFRKKASADHYNVSVAEALFSAAGAGCDDPGGGHAGTSTPPSAAANPDNAMVRYVNCCHRAGLNAHRCVLVSAMLSDAVIRRHDRLGTLDGFFSVFSEQPMFGHFAPSIFFDRMTGNPRAWVREAREIDGEMARVFTAVAEPTLGRAWSEVLRQNSDQFQKGVWLLTKSLSFIRATEGGSLPPLDIFEIGGGYGNIPRILAHAKQSLESLRNPITLRKYVCFDLPFVTRLQHWYLNRTVGAHAELRVWSEQSKDLPDFTHWWVAAPADPADSERKEIPMPTPGQLWPEADDSMAKGSRLRVELVDQVHRDVFIQLYAEAHARETLPNSLAGAPAGAMSAALKAKPIRLLVAINSWHEFGPSEFFWFYNSLFASPPWRCGVDWVLYVSNPGWHGNDDKVAMLLRPVGPHRFEIVWELCDWDGCFRLLRRRAP